MNFLRIIISLFRFDRANWKAVVLCELAAIVFWTFNAFNKNYSANVRFPILFEFNGDRYTPADHLPKTINLNVTGIGWELFRKYLGFKVPQLIIPLERPSEIKKIVAGGLLPVVSSQIRNLKVNFVATDTLYLRIDKRDAHRYKLVADISNITFRERYGRISPVVILPDSIELEGPESRLHAFVDSIMLTVGKGDVNENFREEVEITFDGSEFVKKKPSLVQVMFEVGQVQIVSKRFQPMMNTKAVVKHDSVTVKFQVPIDRLADFKVTANDIIVNVKTGKQKNHFELPQVTNVPSYAHILEIDSVRLKPN